MGRNGVYYRAMLGKKRESADRGSLDLPEADPRKQDWKKADLAFEEIESAAMEQLTDSLSQGLVSEINARQRRWPLWPLCLLMMPMFKGMEIIWLVCAILVYVFRDKDRKKTQLVYVIDGDTKKSIQLFHDAFSRLGNCSKLWHVAEEASLDTKNMTGACKAAIRTPISVNFGSPSCIKTNIKAPFFPVGKQTLYFFPDMVFVLEKKTIAVISYESLKITCKKEPVVETEENPGDAAPISYTWKYTNKDGEPDRRFKDNRQLPIFNYSEITFQSKTGLNERIMASREDAADDFMRAFNAYLHDESANAKEGAVA